MSRVRWSWSIAGALSLAVLSACPKPPPPPAIVMPADNLGDTTVGVAYSHTITATGGEGSLSYTATGLPTGLSMSGTGTISGTATAAGDFSVTVTAADTAGQTASQAYPLKVYPAPALAPATLPDGTVGAAYSATASATGGKAPLALSQSAGNLPSGLTFNATTGAIAGTPDTAGSSTFTLQARDANGATATQSYTVTISAALSLTATVPSTANVGGAYSGLLVATGGKAPITYSVASGLLPPGVSVNASSGSITGTPTFAGTYTATLAATDANGALATRTATINVFSNAPPAVVTTTLPNGVVGSAYSASLVAQFGRPPYAWSLGTGSSLPAGLTLAGNGTISGTPTATGPTDFQVVVTDANGQTATGALRISVFTGLAITTSSLPEGYATLAYPSTQLAAAGGQTPYTWSLSGALPTGMVFTSGTATLSGTPSSGTAGSYGVTFTVTDGSGQTASASFTINLFALPQVTTTTLADASVGASYSQLLQSSGGKSPLTWTITTGSLPAGVLLDANSGSILGTPTAAGTSTFVVQVADANGKTATKLLSITVYNGLAITYGPAPDGYTSTAYSQTLTASGGRSPYTWSLSAGALPAGVTLNGGAGTLSGTPTATGTSSFTLQVTDANNVTATKALSITVYDPPRLTTGSLPDGYVGQVYPSVTLQGTAGKAPYTYAVTAGALPPGLTLTSAGVLSGTPTAVSTASITVTLTDQNGRTATQSYTFGTYTLPSISTTSLADGYTGSAYSRTVTTSNTGKLPITWTVVSGSLPAGLSLADSATQQDTGIISGTPTTPGTATFTVQAKDANNQSTTASLSIAIFAPPSIANGSLPDGTLNVAYSATLLPSGGKSPYAWTVIGGALPAGLSLASATGVISGTPSAAGSSTFSIQLADANGVSASKSFTITVYTSLTISTSSPLPNGEQGAAYSQTVRAVGGRTPITFTLTAGALPGGLTMTASPPDGAAIGGTPTSSGTFTFTLTATDSTTPSPQTTSKVFQLTIAPQVSISTATLADGYLGLSYSDAVVAANGVPPYRFAVGTGALPAGLNLDPNTGSITGIPTATGPSSFTITATDALNQVASRSYTVGVYAPPSISTTSPLRDGYAGTAFSLSFAGTGGKAPYAWSVASGTLATGLTLDAAGNLNGTPSAAGSFAFSIKLTDANGQAAIKSFTQEVLAQPAITNTSVPEGYVGTAYPVTTITGTGGRTPYTFAITAGALPAGLTFTSGTISGTPTTPQSGVTFTVTLTDANGVTAPKTFTTNVYAPPSIAPGALPDAYAGTAYSQTLTGSGGKTPYTWTIASGALPAGLTLSTAGVISGTTAATGTASFVVRLTDANGVTATLTTSLTVLPALQLTTVSLPDGYLTTAYTGVLAASGGKTPYTFSISVGALPSGLSLTASSGAITGTPTAAGTSNFTAQVTDGNGRTATAALSIAVFALPQVSTTALADAYSGSAYSASVAGTGGKTPYTFAVTAGSLPTGLTLAAGGAITGTPTGAPGTSTFTVTLTDANGVTANRSLSITVLSALAVTTASLSDGYTGAAYNQTLAATGGKTPYRWSSGALPAGLSLNTSTGAITGTPTATGTTTVAFTVFDANNASASRSLTITVYAPPQVTAATLPDAYPSVSYLATISGTGGKTPYTFSASAGLPAGLSMSTAGAISGNTTAAPGTASFTVTLTDANGVTATQSFTITVRADVVVTTSALADAYVTSAYSANLAASGGKTPYTWSIGSGTLPAGVTLDPAGILSGTPTAAGTSSFTVRATDANGVFASRALTIQTYALPAITTTSLTNAVVNAAYNQPLAMTGGKSPFTWTESGALPPGITFNTSTGVFSGTPTTTGTFGPINVLVTDANGRSSSTVSYTLDVVNTVTITTAAINDAYQGIAFNQTLAAAGGLGAPYTFQVTAGALPAGLTLSSSGTLSGTTTAAVGSYTFTVTARDSGGVNNGSKAFTQSVWAAPAISTTSLPDGYTDQSYSATMAGTGGRTPYSWTLTAGALPPGLTLTPSTGAFSGQPTATGTSNFTVQLADANGATATKALSIASFAPPSQTSPATLADGYLTTAYSVTLAVSGGKSPFTWTAGSGLPAGITLSSAGVLSGTPGATGAFTFSTTATDANGRTAVLSHTINVFALPAITTSSPLPDGYRSVAYNATLAATGGSPPLTWSLTSGALPGGLTLSSGGAITGTPTASGTFNFTVTVTDRNGTAVSKPFALTVQPPLAVTKTTVADGYVGRAYTDTMTATGGKPPYTWSVSSGTLPAGVTLSTAGAFSGTPTTAGSSSFVVTVTDANGTTATQALTLAVFAVPSITTTSFADAYVGQAYSATAAGTGGKAPYTWSVTTGALPAGLTLNGATGAISGTTTGATQTFTLTLTDANGVTASGSFTITVYSVPTITSTSPLADGYANQPYSFTFAATGGKAPLTWAQTSGATPPGLTISSAGVLGSTIGTAGNNAAWSFTVSVTDANGRVASAPFQMTTYIPPSITTSSLTTATEGVTYMKAPATPEQLAAANGKSPLTFSSGIGLPTGITLASATGIFSGIPAQGTAGAHSVVFTVTDANGKTGTATLNLQVKVAAPIYGGGTVGTAPAGSPITDTLTVFTTDYEGRRYPNLGVRIRKNGVEYAPVKEALTDSTGKVVFTGLGLNGTTDTVDITVNGKDVANEAWLKLNAAIVSIPLMDYPVPVPRSYANGEIDPSTGKLIVTGGSNPFWVGGPNVNALQNYSQNDLLRLTDSVAGTWSEDLAPGLASAPPVRIQAGMAYANNFHVLFGGADPSTNASFNDTWHYSVATGAWTRPLVGGAIPPPRVQHAMATVGTQIFLFGGSPSLGGASPFNDLYSYNPTTAQWQFITTFFGGPSGRSNMAAAGLNNQMWICGGFDGFTELSDCWDYDLPTNQWQPRGAMPTARQGASMAATPSGNLYVFGGTNFGVTKNDLLVSFGGNPFTTVSAINPPPPREGAVLAAEPSTGRLIMFGGQTNGIAFNDVWTFDPTTNTWTQRTIPWSKAPVGFTLSGAITNGNTGTRSRVTVEASGLSGYTNRLTFNLTSGSGNYTMTGIPAGDTISLTVLNEDTSQAYPNREWSWLDLGVIATNMSGNLTQNVTLPTGPMTSQLVTTTGSYTLPSGWLGSSFTAALARMTRPGYANHPNGFYQVTTSSKTFQSGYFPPAAGTTETLVPEAESFTAANCEVSVAWAYNVSPGPLAPVTLPPGPRSMSPGISGCATIGTGLQETGVLQSPGSTGAPGVSVGDLNGDGVADIALLTGTTVLIFNGQGSGEGAFGGASTTLTVPSGTANSLAIADFDKNGRPDVAVGVSGGGLTQFYVFLQTAPGVFSGAVAWAAGTQVTGLVTGDFNGDGNPDVVAIGSSPVQISEITGRGDGTFNPFITVLTGTSFGAVASAEFNGDTFTDIVYGNGSQLGFLRGTATTLQNAVTFGLSSPITALATGDLDGDGVNDVAAALSAAPGVVQVELNRSNFSFINGGTVSGIGNGAKLAIAELTGDTFKDLAVSSSSNTLQIFRGTGGGALSLFYTTPTSQPPTSIAVGDFNADGNADVVLGESVVGGIPQAELFAAARPIPVGPDNYSFTAPANTQIVFLDRGPANIAWDSEIYTRAASGTVTATFPALSTLKPGRPTPAGQLVQWYPIINIGTPANVSFDNFNNNRLKLDGQTYPAAMSQYRR